MDGHVADGNSQSNTSVDMPPFPDIKQQAEAIASNRKQAELLIAEIQGQSMVASAKADEIEQVRLAAETAKADIDARLKEMSNAVTAITSQIETARVTTAEIASLADSARASNATSSETAKQASAAIESAKQIASTASEIIGKIEGIRDEAVKTQATIAERNAWIENGRNHVATFLQEIETSVDGAKRSAASAEASLQAARTTSEQTTALHATVQATKERVESDASAVSSTRATIEAHAAATKKLAQVASDVEERVAKYEAALLQMQDANRAQSAKIDEILAGATDGSLGGAYRKRGEAFKPSQKNWERLFIASLSGLLVLAGWQAYTLGSLTAPPAWEQLARMMLLKLPFLIPLIWLAIHAARQASFAKRMEEEYAFKATTSFSFEGYRRQMAEVGKGLDANSPLAQLCNNTLKTMATPPGGVYDKQRMDPTPGTAAAEIVNPIVDGVSKAIAAKLPDLKA